MSQKNHKMTDGKLLQTDKKYVQLKLKQKEIITEDYWLRLSNTTYTLILPDDAISNLEIDESHLIVNTTENTKAELETKIED